MGMSGIKKIIYNSKIIKVKENVYFCIWNKWTVKIQLSENQQEYGLHYNGVYVTNCFKYEKDEDFLIVNYLTLQEHIKKEGLNLF